MNRYILGDLKSMSYNRIFTYQIIKYFMYHGSSPYVSCSVFKSVNQALEQLEKNFREVFNSTYVHRYKVFHNSDKVPFIEEGSDDDFVELPTRISSFLEKIQQRLRYPDDQITLKLIIADERKELIIQNTKLL